MIDLQLVYSLLGASPIAIILVYYLGKIDNRINLLEQRIYFLEEKKVFEKVKEKFKSKGFWAGVFTAIAGLIGGSVTAPEFLINLINLIGG